MRLFLVFQQVLRGSIRKISPPSADSIIRDNPRLPGRGKLPAHTSAAMQCCRKLPLRFDPNRTRRKRLLCRMKRAESAPERVRQERGPKNTVAPDLAAHLVTYKLARASSCQGQLLPLRCSVFVLEGTARPLPRLPPTGGRRGPNRDMVP